MPLHSLRYSIASLRCSQNEFMAMLQSHLASVESSINLLLEIIMIEFLLMLIFNIVNIMRTVNKDFFFLLIDR